MGDVATASPIRIYVGLERAPTEQERVDAGVSTRPALSSFPLLPRLWVRSAPTATAASTTKLGSAGKRKRV
jgi:hypothetical protein